MSTTQPDPVTIIVPVKALKSVLCACSRDPQRNILTSFNINLIGGALVIAATNGRALVSVDITAHNELEEIVDKVPHSTNNPIEEEETQLDNELAPPESRHIGWTIDRPAYLPRAGKECLYYRLLIHPKSATLIREDLRGQSVTMPRIEKAFPNWVQMMKDPVVSHTHRSYSPYQLEPIIKAAKAFATDPTLIFAMHSVNQTCFIPSCPEWVGIFTSPTISASENIASLSPTWLSNVRHA
jgi:hypothetical protein